MGKKSSTLYWFAAELRPYVGKGNESLDYYYVDALFGGCRFDSPFFSKPYLS